MRYRGSNGRCDHKQYADTLGKTVSELTDAEKTIAFNTAAMDGLGDRMVAVGGYPETTASQVQKLKVSASDAAVAFGDELLPALNDVVGQLNRGGESSDTMATKLGQLVVAPYNFGKNLKDINVNDNSLVIFIENEITTANQANTEMLAVDVTEKPLIKFLTKI